jgi:hypothetical protein
MQLALIGEARVGADQSGHSDSMARNCRIPRPGDPRLLPDRPSGRLGYNPPRSRSSHRSGEVVPGQWLRHPVIPLSPAAPAVQILTNHAPAGPCFQQLALERPVHRAVVSCSTASAPILNST